MEDILFFLGYVIFELIFWGVFYGTGYLLIPIISFGKLKPEEMEKDRRIRKLKSKRMLPLTYKTEKITYLKSEHVAGVGMLFWEIIAVIFVIYASQ